MQKSWREGGKITKSWQNSAGSRDKGVYRDMDLNRSCVGETYSMCRDLFSAQGRLAKWIHCYHSGSRVQCWTFIILVSNLFSAQLPWSSRRSSTSSISAYFYWTKILTNFSKRIHNPKITTKIALLETPGHGPWSLPYQCRTASLWQSLVPSIQNVTYPIYLLLLYDYFDSYIWHNVMQLSPLLPGLWFYVGQKYLPVHTFNNWHNPSLCAYMLIYL